MSNLSTLPKGDSAWLLRKAIERIIQQVSVLETNIGSSTTGNSADTQVIFNDAGTLRGDTGLTYDKGADRLSFGAGICYGLLTSASATITGAATVGTTLGVTGVSTLTGNAFANGSATVAAGTPGAFANAALTINNRGGVSDLSLIALGYRPNGTVLNGAAYIGFITTSGSGNVLGDLIFGTRSVTTDTAPTERYRIDSTGISTWSVAGTTAMTLDSTGLGIGAVANAKLDVAGAATVVDSRGQLYIHTTDAAAIDVGAQLTLGGVYTGSNNYAFGGIAARKENGTTNVAGYLDFLTTTSAGALTSRMRIDSTGNVGIGVTPSAWSGGFKGLQISGGYGSIGSNANADTRFYSGGFYGTLGNTYAVSAFPVSMYQQSGGIHSWHTAAAGTAGNAITDFASAAMTLDASGNLLVGVTSALASGSTFQNLGTARQVLTLKGNDSTSYTLGLWSATTTGDNFFAYFGTEASTTVRGSVTYNRAGGLVLYNTTSDYRAKDIIGSVLNSGSLIDSLKVYVGKMKGATIERPMLIAHEVQEIAPYAVNGEKDSVDADGKPKYQQMDASALVPLLIAEIQSLRTRVQTLEAR